jgi:transcriptional regulator of arginine metabolism
MAKSLIHQGEKRKEILVDLIKAGKIHSQADVVKELEQIGIEVTQATASRDLQEIGAMRARGTDGVLRYLLAPTNSQISGGSLILSIASSGNIVVLKTPPAAAQFLASSLDRAIQSGELPTAIGTIAGDDTVLVVASTALVGEELSMQLSRTFGKES